MQRTMQIPILDSHNRNRNTAGAAGIVPTDAHTMPAILQTRQTMRTRTTLQRLFNMQRREGDRQDLQTVQWCMTSYARLPGQLIGDPGRWDGVS